MLWKSSFWCLLMCGKFRSKSFSAALSSTGWYLGRSKWLAQEVFCGYSPDEILDLKRGLKAIEAGMRWMRFGYALGWCKYRAIISFAPVYVFLLIVTERVVASEAWEKAITQMKYWDHFLFDMHSESNFKRSLPILGILMQIFLRGKDGLFGKLCRNSLYRKQCPSNGLQYYNPLKWLPAEFQ